MTYFALKEFRVVSPVGMPGPLLLRDAKDGLAMTRAMSALTTSNVDLCATSCMCGIRPETETKGQGSYIEYINKEGTTERRDETIRHIHSELGPRLASVTLRWYVARVCIGA